MIMLALALALAAPLTDDQAKVLAAEQDISIRKVVAMDEEIDALKKNHAALAASRSLMEDEIRSIRARFPEVPIASGATIDQATVVSQGLVIHARSGQPIMVGTGVRGSLK